ncbi:hypothetical protein [Serratia sp. ser-z]
MTLTTEQLSAVETTKEFRALLKYMRAIAKAEPESVKEKFELEEGLWRYASQKTIKAIVGHIDALEFALAANREAQPVAAGKFAGYGLYNAERDEFGSWLKPTPQEDCSDAITKHGYVNVKLFTAPPAPAVPEKCPERVRFLMNMHTDDLFSDADAQEIWNACRAAMLAQPVSSGYKLPPHVYRELVNSLRDTAVKFSGTEQLRERLNTALSQFIEPDHPHTRTVAPEGGNG